MSLLQRVSYSASLAIMAATAFAGKAMAQFGGPLPDIQGTPTATNESDIRQIILRALTFVLDFLALIAVVFIIIAGIRLIVSQGEDEEKNKAKKTILYVIVGLLVVLFARVIVGFFTSTVSQQITL